LVGLMVMLTGIVSCATLCSAIGGFLLDLTGMPALTLILLTAAGLTAIAAWGVTQSVVAVAVVTVLEVGTLVVIIALSADRLPQGVVLVSGFSGQAGELSSAALIAAAFLAFYAFVGFEDMVNMAEEVRDAERNLPMAILIAVIVTFVLYLGVGLVAVSLENREALAAAHTPLALLLPDTPVSGVAIGVISILAGLNGALVQLVMASRVAYGMARKGLAPGALGRVSPVTRTPLLATLLTGAVVALLAGSLSLQGLAETSSFIILGVFTLVNLSLAVLRWRETARLTLCDIPWLPLIAAASCAAMLLLRLLQF
jgi:APA family basic amino acid/polyamine antiporter